VLKRLRSKLTYANVMATIAVFLVLTGIGVAVARSGKVGTRQLKNGAVTSKKIHKDSVNASKIKSGAVGRSELANGAVGTGKISNSAVNTSKLANGAVTRAKIDSASLPLISTLNTGQTLRGSFDIGGGDGGAVAQTIRNGESFQFPLLNAPTANTVIDASVASPTFTSNCTGLSGGNQQTPNAAAGQLCVYITFKSANFTSLAVDAGALTRLGFGLTGDFGTGAVSSQVIGQWAVTAP
jgi:hypothetical protein